MAEFSSIDYLLAQPGERFAGGTWSPWLGCSHAGAGCAHCWAEEWASRFPRFQGHWGPNATRYFFGEHHWQQPLRWQRKCERRGGRKRVLVSLCDPFEVSRKSHAQQLVALRGLLLLIEQTPLLDWLVLTKRPDMALAKLPLELPPTLWLGVSIWDQPSADRNIPLLLGVPAALRWISYEPALGPVDVSRWLPKLYDARGFIDWVVIGCESRGPRPGRPCDVQWAERVVAQCAVAGIPCYVKQLPDIRPGQKRLIKSQQLAAERWPTQLPDARLLAPQRAQETVSRGGRAASRTGRDPA